LLQHDDAIDTLGMSKHVVKTRGGVLRRERGKTGLMERIIKNQLVVDGLPMLSGVSTSAISNEMMNVMSKQARKRVVEPNDRRLKRINPKIIR